MHAFDRYRPIIDDWDAFCKVLQRPLPVCVWTNTLRTTPARLARWLAETGLDPTPLAWHPEAFKLRPHARPGNRFPFVTGLYHVQEEVSMLPLPLLDPQPGERILDLCAAPGNKTAQIAVGMQNRGTLVANDRNPLRIRPLRGTMDRLGLSNVTVTCHDAVAYPDAAGHFDRVLADVPCSCEGTARKHPSIATEDWTRPPELPETQEAILRRAAALCRPGGRIVYATCTFAPEENEHVVDAVLQAHADSLTLRPARIDGFRTTPGLTAWDGRSFHPSLERTARVWPHHNDSGGFFIAVLEKRPS